GAGAGAGAGAGDISLSPATVLRAAAAGTLPQRLVLPSPNGATVAHGLATTGVTVVAASLRNAAAVGRWLRDRPGAVAVVAAGERWPDGSLRPAAEDLWGAGAVLAELVGDLSPEAELAVAAHRALEGRAGVALAATASGRELIAAGYGTDVHVAGQLDADDVVPVLTDGAFRPA
ncbi:2-phosphosulfolactate phosphatase, partial [Jatrophihabitans sp. YIM 134969]